ncbi:FUSC family protein [Rhizobium leguminosarum]
MCSTAASLSALYIALALDLGEAKWAAMTVWIVAQASRGMSLSKSRYRGGTELDLLNESMVPCATLTRSPTSKLVVCISSLLRSGPVPRSRWRPSSVPEVPESRRHARW